MKIFFVKNKMIQLFFFCYACTLSPSCSHHTAKVKEMPDVEKKGEQYWKQENSLNFLVIGDWGRNGEFHQQDVADVMASIAASQNSSFVLSMGDNFYPDGVASTQDPQWAKSYENVYDKYSLNIPWYTAFGNHDYRGNIQAQLDYLTISRRWRTKERYYSFERKLPNKQGSVLFVVIDTNPFDATLNREQHTDLAKQDTAKQIEWLHNTLKNTTAEWKIVIGHHPLFTTGVRRGKMLDVRASFLPIFQQYKVNIYFAGHEHDLQHQKPNNAYTHFFVSGAGSEKRPVTFDSLQTKFAVSDHGFMSVQLTKDTLFLQTINYLYNNLYNTKIVR